MRIHHLMNPPIDLNAAANVAKQIRAESEAKAKRKKLFKSAMGLAAGQEDCVVNIGKKEEGSDGQSKQKNQQEQGQKKDAEQNGGNCKISDWA